MSILASDEIADQRYSFCKECEHLNTLNLCSICSCFMPGKVKFSNSSCPIGKWLDVEHQNLEID
jgi:hypothetical protein